MFFPDLEKPYKKTIDPLMLKFGDSEKLHLNGTPKGGFWFLIKWFRNAKKK